ncbi:MAG: hypothetical protein IJ087_22950 [Eggerthellaceae bacterium]|nr:hypothetical protein [Eggerthellaceae bacterium]
MPNEHILGNFERSDGKERIIVVRRSDGLTTYRKQSRSTGSDVWDAAGPDCGIYDDEGAARAEAEARVWWLAAAASAG